MESQSIKSICQFGKDEEGEEADGGTIGQELKGRLLEPGPISVEIIDYIAQIEYDEHDGDEIDEPSILLSG